MNGAGEIEIPGALRASMELNTLSFIVAMGGEWTYVDTEKNPRWYNCSWRARAPKYLVSLGMTIRTFFNTIIICFNVEFFAVLTALFDVPHKEIIGPYLQRLHHFVIPPMVTIVGFYTLFKQRRPTLLARNGETKKFSTYYGMPSGDAMLATFMACMIMESGRKGFAILLILAVCFSRVILGYHSVMQVTVGTLFGFIIYNASLYLGEATFTVINWTCALFLPLLVFFDEKLSKVEKYDYDNLQVWMVVDLPYLTFDMIFCSPWWPQNTTLVVLVFTVSAFLHTLSYVMCEKGLTVKELFKLL